jgi:hypothetical protein
MLQRDAAGGGAVRRAIGAHEPPDARGSVGWWVALAVLAALLVWTRVTGLTRSLWWDEAFTAHRYVRLGTEAIFDPELYSANNHVLYSVVARLSAQWWGPDEWVLRLGVIIPSMLAVGLLVWLLWRRVGPPAAALALALIVASPLAVGLHTEARGYGLLLLGTTVLFAVPVAQHDRPSWSGDLAVAVAGVVAMLSFAPAVSVYLAHTGTWLLLRGVHRVRLVVLTALAGAITALTLRGLLPVMLDGADRVGSRHAEPLRWWSPLVAAVDQQVSPGLQASVPGPAWVATALALVAAVLGVVVLLGRDRPMGVHVVVALVAPVALLALLGFHPIDRYLSFLMPQAITAVAVGAAAACGALAAGRGRASVVAVAALVGLLLLGGVPAVQEYTSVPLQDFKSVAAGVTAEEAEVIAMRRLHTGYAWYLDRDDITLVDEVADLEAAFCEGPRPAVYVPDPDREPPGAPPGCLDEAERVAYEIQRDPGEQVYYVLRE